MRGLTDRQRKILDFLIDFHDDHGFPPTLEEIARRFKMANPSGARDHLVALEKKGYIERGRDKYGRARPRAITVLKG